MRTLETFYRSKEWEALRARLRLERVNENGEIICAECGKPIVKAYDCIAHHKTELTEENVNDPEIALNPDNIELIHFRCHNERHHRFGGFRQRVYLVYGAPCAGKSSFVHEQATPDDLILDIDALWEAVSINDKFHKRKCLAINVFGLRDALLDQIRTRTGKWLNAYVVGGYPLKSDRDRLCDLLNAEPVFIDTDRETCLSRAANDQWREYINEWFDAYTE